MNLALVAPDDIVDRVAARLSVAFTESIKPQGRDDS